MGPGQWLALKKVGWLGTDPKGQAAGTPITIAPTPKYIHRKHCRPWMAQACKLSIQKAEAGRSRALVNSKRKGWKSIKRLSTVRLTPSNVC